MMRGKARWARLGVLLLATGACGAEFRVLQKGDTRPMHQMTSLAVIPVDKPKPQTTVTVDGQRIGGFSAVQEAQLARPTIFGQLLARVAHIHGGLVLVTDPAAIPAGSPRIFI